MPMDRAIAFLTGAIISVMVIFNTELGADTSNSVSILINQAVGIIFLSSVMLALSKDTRVNPPRKRAPWYMWFGGLFGLMVITCNYYSVRETGATIAMGAAVLGQCLAGIALDITGWMWMRKRAISARRAISIIVVAAGIAVMLLFTGEAINPLYALLGIAAGIITMVQMAYNSRFAAAKGAFFSARQNVVSGLIGIALFAFLTDASGTVGALSHLGAVPFYAVVGGGILACFVVVASNTIIPRIPGADSSALMSAGQVMAAAALDWAIYSRLYPALIIGSVMMVIGIAISGRE